MTSSIHNYEFAFSQRRLREAEKADKHFFLATRPSEQADVVARHYISLAHIALELKKIVDHRKVSGSNPTIESLIDRLLSEIKMAHLYDLGIELEWRKIP